MNNVFVCKGTKLAAFLIGKGCRCFNIDIDKKNPTYLVFLFDKNQCCENALNIWNRK